MMKELIERIEYRVNAEFGGDCTIDELIPLVIEESPKRMDRLIVENQIAIMAALNLLLRNGDLLLAAEDLDEAIIKSELHLKGEPAITSSRGEK